MTVLLIIEYRLVSDSMSPSLYPIENSEFLSLICQLKVLFFITVNVLRQVGVRDGIHQGDPISVTKVETSLKLLFLIPILIQCLFICITRWLLRLESYIHRWINIWSFSY